MVVSYIPCFPPPQQQSIRFVAERSDQSETLISVSIPEKAGSFLELYANIFPRNVTEFSYRYSGGSEAHIYMSFQVRASVCVCVCVYARVCVCFISCSPLLGDKRCLR